MGSHSGDWWVVAVEESLEQPLELDGSDDIYCRVPKSLKKENTQIFYVPQAVSFGPFHFGRRSPVDDEVESLKSKVARKYDQNSKGILVKLVKKFSVVDTQKKIRKIYGEGIARDIQEGELSWMMVRDGCFLMAILKEFSEDNEKDSVLERNIPEGQNSVTPSIHGILGKRRIHPVLNDIVKDMFKMENQLPMWVLEEIVQGPPEQNLILLALKKLSPIEVNIAQDWGYNREHHILQLLHDYMVDSADREELRDRGGKPCPSVLYVMTRILRVLMCVFITYFFITVLSPVFMLFFSLCILSFIWDRYKAYITDEEVGEETHTPTIEELQRLGVKFKIYEGRGVYHIKFNKSTLYLPKFKVDDRSETILRNLMALEIYSGDVAKPITRYASLMNDLVNTSADVAILRKYNIITNNLGSDDDVAQLWNSVYIATEMPTCIPIDKAASSINRYCKNRGKVLWAQFRMLHCSKPWLVLSMIGGISLLMLTGVQVGCLFLDCRYHRHVD